MGICCAVEKVGFGECQYIFSSKVRELSSHRQVAGWIYSTRLEFSLTGWVLSPIRWSLAAPACQCHYYILGHLLPCWSLWFVGAEVGWTIDYFSPSAAYGAPSDTTRSSPQGEGV